MSALMRSLKRAVSSSKEPDTPSPQASPHALAPTKLPSIVASPSFSDFSACAHTDAEDGYADSKGAAAPAPRSSLEDFLPSSPLWLRSRSLQGGADCSPVQDSARGSLPQLPPKLSAPPQALPQRREGKIHGMDYYDYCELLRSSSL